MRPKRTHDVTPFDNLDRAAFLLAFLLGAGGSLLLKALGVHQFIPAAYAAAILILYAFIAWAGGRVKIEPETIGDNCYYLGFLFTLASLAYTLFQVADPSMSGGRPVDIPEVISGFGLALSSTIVGVFLRVYLMQLRPDFVAKDREVRAEVNRAFGDFKKNMTGMLSQMKSYAVESVQFASERDERIRMSTEQFLEDHQKALKESSDALSAHMKEAFSEAAQAAAEQIMSAVNESQKAQQEQLKKVIKDLHLMMEQLREQELAAVSEIQERRKVFAHELAQTEKILARLASEKDELLRKASEQHLEENRTPIKNDTDFPSVRKTKAFSKAANDFPFALDENLVAHQTKIKEESEGRRRRQEAKADEDNREPNERIATELHDSEGRSSSREEPMKAGDSTEPPASEDEGRPDPYAQVPWKP